MPTNKKLIYGILVIGVILIILAIAWWTLLKKPADFMCNKQITITGSVKPYGYDKIVPGAKYTICSNELISLLGRDFFGAVEKTPCIPLKTSRELSEKEKITINANVACIDNRKIKNPKCELASMGCQLAVWLEEIEKLTPQQVTITTDKTEYGQGETIKITVRNNIEKPIWYVDFVQRDLIFWEIEKFKDNQWMDPSYEQGGGFRLPREENGKEVCYIKFYELPIGYVAELKPNSEFSHEWNQKICREGGGSPPIFIEKGRYRFTFKFGLNTVHYSKEQLEKEPWKRKVDLTDTKTIYSKEFTIK